MMWAVWCVAAAALGAFAVSAPVDGALAPLAAADWEQIDDAALADESMGNEMPQTDGRYTAVAPWVYLLADMPKDSQVKALEAKRSGSVFSLYPAMEVLQRGAYYNYLEKVAQANRNFLNRIGKRGQKGVWNEGRARPKRKMPSLSINNPMEVLRQRLLLEVARKQMREANQRQAVANRVFLQNVGKRGFWEKLVSPRYEN